MEQVWNIYKVLIEEDREEHFAVFTDEGLANDAINRLRVRDQQDTDVDWCLRSCGVNPDPQMLELPQTLQERGSADIVLAAYYELCVEGRMFVPLWINPAWLVHELKARHDVGIDFKGRLMTLVSPDEVRRRREFGVQDAGFVETQEP
jgi:hypothetical protein